MSKTGYLACRKATIDWSQMQTRTNSSLDLKEPAKTFNARGSPVEAQRISVAMYIIDISD
jgi:hypothetical protein